MQLPAALTLPQRSDCKSAVHVTCLKYKSFPSVSCTCPIAVKYCLRLVKCPNDTFCHGVMLSFFHTQVPSDCNLRSIVSNGLLMGSIPVCVSMCSKSNTVLDGGCLSLHGCRQDMIDRRPNHRPSQVSAGCLGHPRFKVHSAETQRWMTERLSNVWGSIYGDTGLEWGRGMEGLR